MSIGKAAAVVSAGVLASRLLGLVRDAVLAGVLGDTVQGDLFQAAFFLPDLLFYLIAGGYLSITFIPIISKHLADGDENAAWASFAAIARPLAVVMAVLTALAMVFAERLVRLVFVDLAGVLGLAGDTAITTGAAGADLVRLTRIVLPAQFFFMLGSLLMGVQYARNRFAIPSIAPVVYNLSIIAGGLLGWRLSPTDPTPDGFVWGAVVGAVIGNFAIQWYGAHRAGLRWTRGVPLRHPAVGAYAVMALPLMVGQSFAVLDEQLIRVFAGFADDGAITALSLARKVNMVPVGLVAQAATLARLFAEGRGSELRATTSRTLRTAIFVGIGVAAVVAATAPDAIRVLFERGAWTAESTTRAAAALTIFSVSIPLWAAHQLLSRSLYAQRRMWPPVLIGTLATLLALPLYPWAVRAGDDGALLALASVAGITFSALGLGILWFAAHRHELGPLGGSIARSLPGAVIGAAAGRWAAGFVPGDGLVAATVAVAIGGLVSLLCFWTGGRLSHSEELAAVTGRLRSSA